MSKPLPMSWESAPGEYCWSCRVNKHRDCDRHLNDGVHDAEEFITVKGVLCPCPCGGQVGTQYPKMIDLIGALRDEVEHRGRKIERLTTQNQEIERDRNRAMAELAAINEVDSVSHGDE